MIICCKDKAIADAVCHIIEAHGIKCWIAPRDIPPGTEYCDMIADAIHQCKVYIIIFSQYASISKWVKSELNLAIDEQLHIIPFRIDDTPLQGGNKLALNKIHWIDAYPSYEAKLEDLALNVKKTLRHSDSSEGVGCNNNKNKKKPDTKRKLYKWVTFIVLVLCVVCIGGLTIRHFVETKSNNELIYDFNGFSVYNSNCHGIQAQVITEILDSMVYVQGGKFVMGMTNRESKYIVAQDIYSSQTVNVELEDFYISRYELSQRQWNSIMGYSVQLEHIGDNYPMYNISWNDCQRLIDKLNKITGLQFSLPTEAQWEYAARGGNKSKGYIYSGSDIVEDVGWVSLFDNAIKKIGIMDHNELKLYDMTGNVSEWCQDYFAQEYRQSNIKNPSGPKEGTLRVIRGGNVCTSIYDSKICTRQYANPNYPALYTGVRLIIIPK